MNNNALIGIIIGGAILIGGGLSMMSMSSKNTNRNSFDEPNIMRESQELTLFGPSQVQFGGKTRKKNRRQRSTCTKRKNKNKK